LFYLYKCMFPFLSLKKDIIFCKRKVVLFFILSFVRLLSPPDEIVLLCCLISHILLYVASTTDSIWWTIGQLHCFQFYFIKIVFCGISGNELMMTCFWTKHHPISQLVTYFFTCFLLLFLLSFAQLNFSQNCVIFIALCAGNVLSRNRCILEYCLVRCHSLFCNRKRLVATITSAGHTRSIIDFAHKLDMANWRKRRVFFQCCRMSTQLIDWLV